MVPFSGSFPLHDQYVSKTATGQHLFCGPIDWEITINFNSWEVFSKPLPLIWPIIPANVCVRIVATGKAFLVKDGSPIFPVHSRGQGWLFTVWADCSLEFHFCGSFLGPLLGALF
ncbi:MAG: hypothetical protein EB120_13665 [Proteobacteria bacterium]|nr:hypothetical protein [Pseudomonadota bacterium]